jgi:cell division cycle 2-like protein
VYSYERLNSIEEGSYGIVFRARDKQTGDIVALKKLKLDEEKYGFPITALREINSLMLCRHDNVVGIREVVVGETLTQYALYGLHAYRVNFSRFDTECLSSWTSSSMT